MHTCHVLSHHVLHQFLRLICHKSELCYIVRPLFQVRDPLILVQHFCKDSRELEHGSLESVDLRHDVRIVIWTIVSEETNVVLVSVIDLRIVVSQIPSRRAR